MQYTSVDLAFHGDEEKGARLNFAVNVRGLTPPKGLLRALTSELATLGAYPSAAREAAIVAELARRHGVSPDQVVLLAGAAEGFTFIANLGWRNATVIHPGFTEPEHALRLAGVPVTRAIMRPPFTALPAIAPTHLAVLGCPINPTGTVVAPKLPADFLLVDEAFADVTDVSLTHPPHAFVTRSLTKTWNLAGLRAGYMIVPDGVDVERFRPHWATGSLQLAAFEWVLDQDPTPIKEEIAAEREEMKTLLTQAGFRLASDSRAPYLLVQPPGEAEPLRQQLAGRGIAIRRCDTFPGLDLSYWRLAVRPAEDVRELVREAEQCQQ